MIAVIDYGMGNLRSVQKALEAAGGRTKVTSKAADLARCKRIVFPGVGAFGDLGTHSLDILMWMIGDVESVAADIKIVTGRYPGCDECGEALIRFKNGVTGTLAAGWVDIENPVTLELCGTTGHAVIVQDQLYYNCPKVTGADGKAPFKMLPPALPAPMHMFLDAVAGKTGGALVKPAEAAARVAVMEAMYNAHKTGKWAKPA